ncbi:GIY-YIG nuclease family protein [Testudinibacter sp. P80/BLE/0925]|uniref:GIY-YIG nuclease family protein n=1 Tax=Testudinibacter sp. TW-1 TaxID=3417757 RepID=UPI003D365945
MTILIDPDLLELEPHFASDPAQKQWCVYFLLCQNNALYCGISNQPKVRFHVHLSGKGAKFTRMHPPLEMRLIYHGLSRADASRLEAKIKRLKTEQKRQLWDRLAKRKAENFRP